MRYVFLLLVLLIIGAIIYDTVTTKPVLVRGFIVCKEYTPSHMDNVDPRPVQQAIFIPVVAPRHIPQRIASSWIVWCANRDGSFQVAVDSLKYTRIDVGQRWAFYAK